MKMAVITLKKIYENDSEIRILLDQLVNGFFEDVDKYEFKEIFDNLVYRDHYFVFKRLSSI